MILHNLQKYQNGNYLFHGSSSPDISILLPSQAYSFGKKDGDPAVHASDHVEPALFMALIGSKKCGGMGMAGLPGFGFIIAESDWQRANKERWSGYIYIVSRSGFTQKHRWEWISSEPASVIEEIEVSIEELPKEVTIVSDEEYRHFRSKGA